MFQIRNLKFKDILDIDNLTIDQTITCISGASGSGKTTLLKLLNRLYVADQGTILFNCDSIDNMDPVQLRRRVVMLGQTPVIYDGTIQDNLQIGRVFSEKPKVSREDLVKVMQAVGLDKALDDCCGTLSGGEKQRLCLARVMLMDTEVYLLDEPSAALDKETEHFIINNLAEFVLKNNKQLIMVTHSPEVQAMYVDSQFMIANGRVCEHE
ncbi:ABC transporter ATP-binding protein [Paludicola sp. MB14-C6]|uniref:ABC transporter ATP-binding protein n=1 Tax=Paludihabitans sp. MB14-C6 TaxID=3070656 RepID=UPI0027DD8437|nr:ABC transporter ATP-binding protein [Paludicola sp. MB14-C6]WMJ24070.1 ABC transporter ATP-binding protein [Paludicola sp. MB14-C6]